MPLSSRARKPRRENWSSAMSRIRWAVLVPCPGAVVVLDSAIRVFGYTLPTDHSRFSDHGISFSSGVEPWRCERRRLRARGQEPAEGRPRRPVRWFGRHAHPSGEGDLKTVIPFSHPIGWRLVPAAGCHPPTAAPRRLRNPGTGERHRADPREVPARPRRASRDPKQRFSGYDGPLAAGRRRLAVALLPGLTSRALDDHDDAGG